jgi:hypothetical protein
MDVGNRRVSIAGRISADAVHDVFDLGIHPG